MISERAFRMNFEEFQNQSRFYVVGALEPGEVGEALPPCGSLIRPRARASRSRGPLHHKRRSQHHVNGCRISHIRLRF